MFSILLYVCSLITLKKKTLLFFPRARALRQHLARSALWKLAIFVLPHRPVNHNCLLDLSYSYTSTSEVCKNFFFSVCIAKQFGTTFY